MESLFAKLETAHPKSRQDRIAFNLLGCEYVYARPLHNQSSSWLVLVRFGNTLERQFAITREIPIIYSPYKDLQLRTIDPIPQQLKENLPEDRKSVTTDITFISAPDPRLATKLEALSTPGRILLPLVNTDTDNQYHEELLAILYHRLWYRDPYSTRGAVTGQDFFGREKYLQLLDLHVSRGEALGLFGMRKTGKTSLLMEFKSIKDRTQEPIAVAYQDLEGLPSPNREDPVPELIGDLTGQIRDSLKKKGLRTKEIAELPPNASLRDFRTALSTLLKRLDDAKLVIVLDEIESLCPPGVEHEPETPTNMRVRQLFACFRKLTQEGSGRFSFVVAGLASASIEEGIIYGGQNPLFNWPYVYYIGPFDYQEAKTLMDSLGNKVGLTWSQGALEYAYEQSGGHAMLLREIGSHVLKNANAATRTYEKHINKSNVSEIIEAWERTIAGQLKEAIGHIDRYYADESELLSILSDNTQDFADIAIEFPQQIKRLEDLGAISKDAHGHWRVSRLIELGWKVSSATNFTVIPNSPLSTSHESQSVGQLIREGEGPHVEFKSSARTSMPGQTQVSEKLLIQIIIRACTSFMNSEGGTLLIGVSDQGDPLGIDSDIKRSNNSTDKFSLWLTAKFRQYLGDSNAQLVKISLPNHDGKRICRIDVKRSPEPVWLVADLEKISINTGHLLVRNNAECNKLSGEHIIRYVRNHWGSEGP